MLVPRRLRLLGRAVSGVLDFNSKELDLLILTRKAGEDVVITVPDGINSIIRVKVLKTGNIIKLGFEAPEDISIVRSELLSVPDSESGTD